MFNAAEKRRAGDPWLIKRLADLPIESDLLCQAHKMEFLYL
jgi:hypothetical protein